MTLECDRPVGADIEEVGVPVDADSLENLPRYETSHPLWLSPSRGPHAGGVRLQDQPWVRGDPAPPAPEARTLATSSAIIMRLSGVTGVLGSDSNGRFALVSSATLFAHASLNDLTSGAA
jgi:hypothetical protein